MRVRFVYVITRCYAEKGNLLCFCFGGRRKRASARSTDAVFKDHKGFTIAADVRSLEFYLRDVILNIGAKIMWHLLSLAVFLSEPLWVTGTSPMLSSSRHGIDGVVPIVSCCLQIWTAHQRRISGLS